MKRYLFQRFVRALCAFPGALKSCYGVYAYIVVRMPLLRPSYKWRAIGTPILRFELNRALHRRGKPCEPSLLNDVTFVPDGVEIPRRDRRKGSGEFGCELVFNGLAIRGKAGSASARSVSVLLDGKILRKVALSGDRSFWLRIGRSALASFPRESRISLRLDTGDALKYRGAESALLRVPSGSGMVRQALDAGYLLDKRGGIRASADSLRERQDRFLALYIELRDAFDSSIGRPLFLTYGTLLGFVRGGDLLPNDDDFDAGYVSLEKTPERVKEEALRIMSALLREGFSIKIGSFGRLFKISKGAGVHLDLMPVWFEKEWNVAYRGICVKAGVDDFLPAAEGSLRGCRVYTPRRPEVFLAGYYGENWRVPDPGYVSDLGQTGKDLRKNYARFLMTPLEFLKLERAIERERESDPRIGRLVSARLEGEL